MLKPKMKLNLKALEDLTKAFPEESRKARYSRITEAVMLLEREIKQITPEGAGPTHFKKTIFSKVEYGEPVLGFVGSPAIYGEALEYGTKPHFPPVAPILFWVEKVLGLSGKEAKSAAYAIVQKIGKRGTYGAHMFQYGFERNRTAVMRILRQITDDIVEAVTK